MSKHETKVVKSLINVIRTSKNDVMNTRIKKR